MKEVDEASINNKEEVKEIMNDIIVGKGVANAMKYFGDRGMLGIDFDMKQGPGSNQDGMKLGPSTDIVIGRNNDQTL